MGRGWRLRFMRSNPLAFQEKVGEKTWMSPDRRLIDRTLSFCTASLLLLAGSIAASCDTSYTIRFTAAEIQQSLNRRLPISRSKFLVSATVQSLAVELLEGNDRIQLRPQVELSIAGQSAVTGRALVEGQIRYAPDAGEFFLDAPKVVDVTIAGIPESTRPVVGDLIAKCGEAYFATTPVYRLKQTDFKQSLAKMLLKSVKVHDGQLQAVIGVP